jgi:hypothetical protein
MENQRNRPVITSTDHPMTIFKALRRSTALLYREQSHDQAFWWEHVAHNSWETLGDEFGILDEETLPLRPEGKRGGALLHMSFDYLEYALVGYGAHLIENHGKKNVAEIDRVDDILRAIDKALNRKKY